MLYFAVLFCFASWSILYLVKLYYSHLVLPKYSVLPFPIDMIYRHSRISAISPISDDRLNPGPGPRFTNVCRDAVARVVTQKSHFCVTCVSLTRRDAKILCDVAKILAAPLTLPQLRGVAQPLYASAAGKLPLLSRNSYRECIFCLQNLMGCPT